MSKPIKWTKELLYTEAKKYNRRVDFQKFSRGAYLSAKRQGLLEDVCSHMQPNATKKYTQEQILEIAKQFKTRTEFQKGSKAYASAFLYGKDFLDLACAHMISPKKVLKHTKETAAQDAIKYKTRREFCVNDAGSYLAAVKNGWIDDICKHMDEIPKTRVSKQELKILQKVQEYFPDARKKVFYNKSSDFRQSRYELDIFIPSLNKGIEYDGSYWHSPDVLAKRKNISLEEAEKYHEEKDQFFNQMGIKVLHIKENHWKINELWQTRIILDFIGILPKPPNHQFFKFMWRQNADENGEF
jgi:hypothetical protein